MRVAHDLYAETNPAFGTYTAVSFCRKYCQRKAEGAPITLFYLALPIAMSRDTCESFDGTNATTGLMAWLNRYPDIRLNLGSRLDASLDIVSASLKMGLISRSLALGEGGALLLGANVPTISSAATLPAEPKKVLRRAERLGGWMADAGSVSAIISSFGVTL